MVDEDFFDELEKEFGSASRKQSDNPEDIDEFLADLKRSIAPHSESDTSRASGTRSPAQGQPSPAAVKREPRQKPQKPQKQKPQKPQKEPTGLAKVIIRHHVVINTVLSILCLLLIAGIAAVFYLQSSTDPLEGKIMDNVYVAGVPVGGMTQEEALNAVSSAVSSSYRDGMMVVELGSSQLLLSASYTQPTLQVQSAVEAAYAFGRTGSTSDRQKDYRDAQYGPKQVALEPYLSVNSDYIRSTVSAFISQINSTYSPSGYTLEGEKPSLNADDFDATAPCQTLVLTVGTPGSNFNLDGICSTIYQGYCQNLSTVTVPSDYLPDFPEKLNLDDIYREICEEPVEAVEKPGTSEVIPGSVGYIFQLEDAKAKLNSADYGQVVSIPMEYVMPQKLDLNGSFIETLGTYSTAVTTDESYNQNLKLLCKQLDGLVLQPGETFSFNTFFKDRTEKNGYVSALCYPDHCIDKEMGGGANQVAATLYAAAMLADMNITEKHSAEHLCDFITTGLELSVSSQWQDLKVNNSHKFPVKIRAKATDKQVVIKVLSEKALDYYIKLETLEQYPTAHGTAFYYAKASEGYADGQILYEGMDGCQVTLTRIKLRKSTNEEISRTSEVIQARPSHTMKVMVSG